MSGVLCSGAIVYDILAWPVEDPAWGATKFVDKIEFHAGGNCANSSIALGVLGTPVRAVGVIGGDEPGRFVLARLQAAGVDTSFVQQRSQPTPVTLVMVNSAGDRKFLHRPGVSAEAFTEPLEFTSELARGFTHYHAASFFILPGFRATAPETLRRARAAGLVTSFDANWDPWGRWMQDIGPCLPHIDMFFANEDEARMLTGFSTPRQAASALLSRGAGMAIMKLGPRGCAIFTNQEEIRCPAYETGVRDTTGAGDCFVAGFLSACLRGASLAEAGQFANAAGALAVQKIGATAGLLPLPEIEQWMRVTPLKENAGGGGSCI